MFEIIVCGGGSTDGTLEYLSSIKNIRVIKAGMIGLAKLYKNAFNDAEGKYILN